MAHDYRYFPEPDLPPLKVSELNFDLSLPELPNEKRKRFKEKYGLKEEAIEVFIRDIAMGKFFEAVCKHLEAELPSTLGSSASKLTAELHYFRFGRID